MIFPDDGALLPGQVGRLTYETQVTAYSNTPCVFFLQGGDACAVTYGAIGDPVARGGGSSPRIQGLDIGNYEFQRPTFNDGIINFEVISGPGIVNQVNAPSALIFSLLFTGFLLPVV